MSHLTSAPFQFRDLDALRAAVKHFGGELIEAKTFVSYQQYQPCKYAIKLPGVQYQVGVRKTEGYYTLHYDPYGKDGLGRHDGHKLEKILGKRLGLLNQRCATEVALKAARAKGVMVSQHKLPNGTIQLRMAV